MNFAEAKNYIVPWGEFVGQTIDKAATTDRGLSRLDWMRGILEADGDLRYAADRREFREALRVYLDDPTIAKDVKNLAKS